MIKGATSDENLNRIRASIQETPSGKFADIETTSISVHLLCWIVVVCNLRDGDQYEGTSNRNLIDAVSFKPILVGQNL